MQMPSITDLEAERQRRQIEQIARLARSGGELPLVLIEDRTINKDDYNTIISLGPVSIAVLTQLGGPPRHPVVRVSNQQVEEKLYALFQDPIVTKILYDHIFDAFEKDVGKDNGTLRRYGDTQFCG